MSDESRMEHNMYSNRIHMDNRKKWMIKHGCLTRWSLSPGQHMVEKRKPTDYWANGRFAIRNMVLSILRLRVPVGAGSVCLQHMTDKQISIHSFMEIYFGINNIYFFCSVTFLWCLLIYTKYCNSMSTIFIVHKLHFFSCSLYDLH